MKRPSKSSLFWTLTGSFLLVLILAGLLQALVVVAVIEPLVGRVNRDRAILTARETAARLEASAAAEPEREIIRALRETSRSHGPVRIVFRRDDGRVLSDRGFSRRARRGLIRFLSEELDSIGGGVDSTTTRFLDHGFGPFGEGRPPDGGPPGFPEDRGFDRRRMEIAARIPVAFASGGGGEFIVIAPGGRFPLLPTGASRRVLLFLPVALLLAGTAGLIIFRLLVRRLAALERLADRVAAGDLEARVGNVGSDEIGRLGASLDRMTDSLAAARRRIEESDRQRRRLLADISHELGTPLTSIRGYAETLLDPGVPITPGERESYLRNVLKESERMDYLIQDLLELTRLEAGATRLDREIIDWAALGRHTLERFAPRFREAGLSLAWTGPGDPAWISADGRRMEQVLENLLINALRYVPGGGSVRLSVGAAGDPEWKELILSDDGPGIPEADRSHVFDRFYRADSSRTTGGSGLGLAIVKEIIQRHDGRITAAPNEPRGTIMTVSLPAHRGPEGAGS